MTSEAAHGTMSAQRTTGGPEKSLLRNCASAEADQHRERDHRDDPDHRVAQDRAERAVGQHVAVVARCRRRPGAGR